MESTLHLVPAAGVGLGVGLFFYGFLWLTVRRLHECTRPWLLLLTSFLGRAAVVLVAFYLLAGHGLSMVLVAAFGFLIARAVLVRYIASERRPVVGRASQ